LSRPPDLIADAIPLLDGSTYLAGERAAPDTLAAERGWAFENVGWHGLRGHGVDRSLFDATTPLPRAFTRSRSRRSSPPFATGRGLAPSTCQGQSEPNAGPASVVLRSSATSVIIRAARRRPTGW
jgi:hypothetical protein